MAVGKKKRTSRKSKGIHGASKHPLTEVQKVLMGKGRVVAMKPFGVK